MKEFNKLLNLVGVFCALLGAVSKNSSGAEVQWQPATTNASGELPPELTQPKSTIWQAGVGEGFLPTAQTFAVELGVAPGIAAFGSVQAHDFALMSLSYGHMLGYLKGEGHWYRGNFEGRVELWGGGQYSPYSEWIIGLTPHLRYDFATGSRWVPFFDLGAGVTATGIGPPDLSGTFEFNLQATIGVHYFLRENLALTSDVRFLHISCAGIHQPNLGANNVAFMVGLTWFFGS